jgi:GH35 family endo-1,4-beta-xylanase
VSRWTRRECLQGASAAAFAAWAGAEARSETDPSLDALARRSGRRFGTALSTRGLRDEQYLRQVRRECGLLVAENEHKWYVSRTSGPPTPKDRKFPAGFRSANGAPALRAAPPRPQST